MAYFDQFPRIAYQFVNEKNRQLATDIIKRIKVRDKVINEATLYEIYYVKDGETPDMVAANAYGDSNQHWIILLTNTIINPWFDWPMSESVLKRFVQEKYPGTHLNEYDQETPNYYATHHWELESPIKWRDGIIMPTPEEIAEFDPEYLAKLYDPGIESIKRITNIEYEELLNDERRKIHIFKAALVPTFEAEFKKLIRV